MIVDSYAHVSPRKYRPAERLVEQMQRAGVDRAILVQPLGDFDNSYLQTIARRYPRRFQTVALVDVSSVEAGKQAKNLIQTEGFAGVRVVGAGLGDPHLISAMAEAEGVLVPHLPEGIGPAIDQLATIADRFASLRIFLPHLGWPQSNGRLTSSWNEAVVTLSQYPQIAVGISALYYFSSQSFPHADTWDWVQLLIETFSPERCLCGSDFPLLLEAESYPAFFSFFVQGGMPISSQARDLILGGAAIRFWRTGE